MTDSIKLLMGIGVTHEYTPRKDERPGTYGMDPRARDRRQHGISAQRSERSIDKQNRRERSMRYQERYQDYSLI